MTRRAALIAIALALSGCERRPAADPKTEAKAWLEQKKSMELAAAFPPALFADFRFTDRVEESRIRFVHRIVDDAGKNYKAVHYDHGNGLAAADVDGDGRIDLYFLSQLGGNQLWRNAGDGRFEDITSAAGVALADRVSV